MRKYIGKQGIDCVRGSDPPKEEEKGLRREPREKVEEYASTLTNENCYTTPSIKKSTRFVSLTDLLIVQQLVTN